MTEKEIKETYEYFLKLRRKELLMKSRWTRVFSIKGCAVDRFLVTKRNPALIPLCKL